MTKSTSLLRG